MLVPVGRDDVPGLHDPARRLRADGRPGRRRRVERRRDRRGSTLLPQQERPAADGDHLGRRHHEHAVRDPLLHHHLSRPGEGSALRGREHRRRRRPRLRRGAAHRQRPRRHQRRRERQLRRSQDAGGFLRRRRQDSDLRRASRPAADRIRHCAAQVARRSIAGDRHHQPPTAEIGEPEAFSAGSEGAGVAEIGRQPCRAGLRLRRRDRRHDRSGRPDQDQGIAVRPAESDSARFLRVRASPRQAGRQDVHDPGPAKGTEQGRERQAHLQDRRHHGAARVSLVARHPDDDGENHRDPQGLPCRHRQASGRTLATAELLRGRRPDPVDRGQERRRLDPDVRHGEAGPRAAADGTPRLVSGVGCRAERRTGRSYGETEASPPSRGRGRSVPGSARGAEVGSDVRLRTQPGDVSCVAARDPRARPGVPGAVHDRRGHGQGQQAAGRRRHQEHEACRSR